jgi:hypothetical protein
MDIGAGALLTTTVISGWDLIQWLSAVVNPGSTLLLTALTGAKRTVMHSKHSLHPL